MSSQPTFISGGVSITGPPPQQGQQLRPNGWSLDGLFFDAWLTMSHQSSLTTTQHPVESGADVTDHAYVNPKRFSFEIGITNATPEDPNDSFPAAPTRVVNAYNALLNRQENRQPMRLICKYGTYDNILIETLVANDDAASVEAGFFTVNLIEIIQADVRQATVNLLPQTVNQTNRGDINGQTLSRTALSYLTGFQQAPQDAA